MKKERASKKALTARNVTTSSPDGAIDTAGFLRLAASGSKTGIARITPNGRIAYINETMARLHGYRSEDLIDAELSAIQAPDQERQWAEAFRCADDEGLYSGRLRHAEKEGRVFETKARLQSVQDESGSPIGYLLNILPVGKGPSEKKSQTGGNRYQILFERNLAGIYRTTIDGQMLECNDTLVRILGYDSKEDLMKISVFDLYFESSDRSRLLDELWEKNSMTNWEQRVRKKDGSEIWTVMNIRLTHDADHGSQVVEGTLIDITERYQAQESVRKSEELHRFMAENISDTLWILDIASLGFVYISPSVSRMRGYSPKEAIELTLEESLTPESYEHTVNTLTGELSRDRDVGTTPDRDVTLELEMYCKDGSTIWTEVHCRAIRDESGDIARILGVTRDISARKEWEETLRVERERFRALVDESPLGVSLIDPKEDRYEYFNQRFTDLFGYTHDDLPTRGDWFAKAFPDDKYRKVVMNTWLEDLAKYPRGQSRPRTFNVTCKNGEVKTIHFRPVTLGNGAQLITYEDITESRILEENLTNARNYLQKMIDSMPSLLMTVDRSGLVTGWNAEAYQRTGLDVEEVKGRPLGDAVPALKKWNVKIRECIDKGRRFAIEKMPIEFRGMKSHFDLVIYPIEAANKPSAVVRLDDVTERVRLEQMVFQAEKMASVGRLAAGVAHEINNPLAGVLQGSQMIARRLDLSLPRNEERLFECGIDTDEIPKLERYLKDSRVMAFLRGIDISGKRAANIISNMMEFSRSGKIRFNQNALHEIIDQALSLIYTNFDLNTDGILQKLRIEKIYTPHLENVPCDRAMIQQSLFHLIKNSIESLAEYRENAAKGTWGDFTPTIRIETRQTDQFAEIAVSDNGPGVPIEYRDRLFEPFFTTKSIDVHTGLGLYASFGIIHRHRGTIEHLRENNRTKFVIWLPLESPQSINQDVVFSGNFTQLPPEPES